MTVFSGPRSCTCDASTFTEDATRGRRWFGVPPHTPSPLSSVPSTPPSRASLRFHGTLQLVNYSDARVRGRAALRAASTASTTVSPRWFTHLSYIDYISCVFVQYSRWSIRIEKTLNTISTTQNVRTRCAWRVLPVRGCDCIRGPRIGESGYKVPEKDRGEEF
ncbi:hypothetical protein K466DRAFT_109182 [Polyporus arcularius HHB13444]|uniref:Uncharacterized protein n=1 Tax=Polyporus arcularius HHB13444 TaxID=1314778 RepID=A0A5C3PZF9_9APHY|nr:hypothetical protein K466DRAFT_109182 [Polyporus arcularius HHB13444]